MKGPYIFLAFIVSVIAAVFLKRLYVLYKRKKIMAHPINTDWIKILHNNIAIYQHLPAELKEQLHDLMKVFVAEKNFEGCAGLKITEEIKVTIAAQACVLILNRSSSLYSGLDSILVYPSSYFAKDIEPIGSGAYLVGESNRIGESWKHGTVVLAWDHVQKDAMDMDDGQNVVFHEFAHQLDEEPSRPSSYLTWARVFCRELQKLKRNIAVDKEDVIDDYGAVNPAEFFAVATESFFKKAVQIKKRHPALYKILKDYYKLDPAKWVVPDHD